MTRKCALVLLIFAMTVLPAAAQTALSAGLESILQASSLGQKLNQALAAANAYVAAHPDDGNGFAVRCEVGEELVEQHAGDMQAVASDCARGLALAPQSAFAHFAAAGLFYDDGYFKASLDQYNQAIVLGEDGRGVFWRRCVVELRVGHLDDALNDCNTQVTLTPGDPFARYARGRLQIALHAYAAAITDLTAALSKPQPAFVAGAFYWRGVAFAALKEDAAAEADLSSAIAHGDTASDVYLRRAQVRQNLGRQADAQADLKRASEGYRAAGLAPTASPSPLRLPPR
jgi:tetratricopeptide (TPR) repeat protein